LIRLARTATLGLLRPLRHALAWCSRVLVVERHGIAVRPVCVDRGKRDAHPPCVLFSVTHPGYLRFGWLRRLDRSAGLLWLWWPIDCGLTPARRSLLLSLHRHGIAV